MVRESRVNPHQLTLAHSLGAAVGSGLIARLPTFPDAPMSRVLAARDELLSPLARYRTGMRELSSKVSSMPYSNALQVEITDLWRDEVQPALVSLERGVSRLELYRSASRNLVTDYRAALTTWAGATFGVGLAEINNLSTALPVAGAALASSLPIISAMTKAGQARDDDRSTNVFYLLELNRKL